MSERSYSGKYEVGGPTKVGSKKEEIRSSQTLDTRDIQGTYTEDTGTERLTRSRFLGHCVGKTGPRLLPVHLPSAPDEGGSGVSGDVVRHPLPPVSDGSRGFRLRLESGTVI